jgi:2-methylcitrate dehydratase PrpD
MTGQLRRSSSLARLGEFVVGARPPDDARGRAAVAVRDTIGVALAGASEPAARAVQTVVASEGGHACTVWGTAIRSSASSAALANGTAAHALDFDDMCFVSLAHPSAPLVPAALAAAEEAGAAGRVVLDAYIVGFEIEARLGVVMNPRHYQRGWHCTSTLGSIGAAAAASRVLGLTAETTAHALAIAASSASGLKENFGTMVKPLHAGLAARNGALAALLARGGMIASALAIDGPQGFLRALDAERTDIDDAVDDLGSRWEMLDTGVTVKLYPSCAGTHPALDTILDLRKRHRIEAADVERVTIDVDAITPTILIHDRPGSGLEGKFSMPFCVAAALACGRVDVGTFTPAVVADPAIGALMSRVAMRVDPSLEGRGAPLTQARVTIALRDGRVLAQQADGARGYPAHPASDEELDAKFLACASTALAADQRAEILRQLHRLDEVEDVRPVVKALAGAPGTAHVRASTP